MNDGAGRGYLWLDLRGEVLEMFDSLQPWNVWDEQVTSFMESRLENARENSRIRAQRMVSMRRVNDEAAERQRAYDRESKRRKRSAMTPEEYRKMLDRNAEIKRNTRKARRGGAR